MSNIKVQIRRAGLGDAKAIWSLIRAEALKEKLLYRSLREVREFLDLFFVVEDGDKIVGCVALEVYYVLRKGRPKLRRLAEIRSLAVDLSSRRKGYGKLLVEACLVEAKRQGVNKVLSVTSALRFFKSMGFSFATEKDDRFALFHNLKSRS